MLVDSLYFPLRRVGGLNLSSILKAFSRQLWVCPVNIQLKSKLGTGIVSYTVLRNSLLNLTSFQVSSSVLCPRRGPFSQFFCAERGGFFLEFYLLISLLLNSSAGCACLWGKAKKKKRGNNRTLILKCVASSSFDSTIACFHRLFKSPRVIVFVYFVQSF